ncbi:MAG: hypothetical protein AAFU64_14105, partial [Bacteroidota bacterium]
LGRANTNIGTRAGYHNLEGEGNVFIGYQAGMEETGSNKLYIANNYLEAPLIYGEFDNKSLTVNGSLGIGIKKPERPIHLRAQNAIFRIDRDRADPGFAIVRYDEGFQNIWKSFYFYTRGKGSNDGKFVIADWEKNVSGPDHKARFIIDNEGDIGIGPRFENLDNNASAKLHVDGSVRLQNLPSGSGSPLLIDKQGNLFVGASAKANTEEMEKLQSRVESLEQEIAKLKQMLGQKTEEESPTSQLFQNQPNPLDQSTRIPYRLAEEVQEALILITDWQGKEVKRYILEASGEGEIHLQTERLASGLYLYSLVIDGKLSDTKRMLIKH